MPKRFLMLLALLVAAAVSSLAAEKPQPVLEIGLNLYNAVFNGETQSQSGPTLLLDLARHGDRWDRVWGMARNFNVANHAGRVIDARVTARTIDLSLEMNIEGDAWVPGGRAKYQVKLAQAKDGTFQGTYNGTFRGVPVQGKAEGTIKPARKRVVANYVPVQPGEHPRILFRKQELPALRARAKTPFGQAAIAKMGGPVGLGMKYQLLGERDCAAQAIPLVEDLMSKGLYVNQFGNNVGDRAEQVAITYDLCYDAWTPGFRQRVENYLAWVIYAIMFDQQKMSTGINWHVCSNWSAPLFAGAGFAGLALWGEKGPEPGKPISPSEADAIAPADEYTPGAGVPVEPLVLGKSPSKWLALPPLDFAVDGDPLAEIGGVEHARPEQGTKLVVADKELTFQPLASPFVLPEGGVNLTELVKSSTATLCFYTVLQNDRQRTVKLVNPYTRSGRPLVVLNGNVLNDGRVVELQPGRYPMLVLVRLMTKWSSLRPHFVEASVQDIENARDLLAARQGEYRESYKDWQDDFADWQRLGGANINYLRLFTMARRMMYYHYREAEGTGGFQAEVGHYSIIATYPPGRYAAAYRTMFGEDVSPYDDITMVVPRKMFVHLYRPDGTALAQDINGDPGVPLGYYSAFFPIVPDAYKPAVLWAWNRQAGVKSADDLGKLLDADPVRTFLNYPLTMAAKPPQGIMPLTWQAPDFGFYGFRNSWEGKDDFILQAFLKSHYIGGWNGPNGGTFRLLGLGQVWTVGTSDRNRCRWEENVVQFPEQENLNESAGARTTYLKTEKDGSGVLSMDMTDIYSSMKTDASGRRLSLYENYGNIRHASALQDVGIKGMRSIAVDYSGLSGAPCLFVVVDKISGGKSKVWTWQLERGDGRKTQGDLPNTRVDGNTFTITKGDATLRGVFVPTGPLTVTAEVRSKSMIGGAGSSRGKVLPRPIPGVFAEGADSYFAVITIQRGPAPEVKIEGTGLDAKVIVGKRAVSFDGEKVVFSTGK